jgi:hypothetical protein
MTYEEFSDEEAAATELPQHVPVDHRDTRISELERKIAQLESPDFRRLRLLIGCTVTLSIAWLLCYVSYRIFPDILSHILSWTIIHNV